MTIVKILLGLVGLGVVVLVHELGHFIFARLMGIDVQAFSIGWGKPILRKKIGQVEYRLGMFPIGGYCKMKGENEFQEAYENREKEIKMLPGTFFGASPWRRILVCLAGPLFNLIFAVLVLSVIWGIGFKEYSPDNRIVLVSDVYPEQYYPADEAGLKSGDRIVAIQGKKIVNFRDIQKNISIRAEKVLPVTVERDGNLVNVNIQPALEKSTGAGQIGIYSWVEPVVSAVAEGSPAAIAGIQAGDRIVGVNGQSLSYTADLSRILKDKPPVLEVEYERDGSRRRADLVVSGEDALDFGLAFRINEYQRPPLFPWIALVKGAEETWENFTVSLGSLRLLFRGIDLTKAVSGPVRITYMVGEVAAAGFGESISTGLSSMANFLSLISIALCVMNLLPLPVLDGGMILLFIIETIKRRPLHPRFVFVFQTIGVMLIFGIMIFAVFGDILYLTGR
ncbi:MAG: RIP metalloprotease RseP [Treponema sp.]|jgi:regulator of sigma E protease|nr:RIP metalloprotease RseP [Treponema sp.]